jgi:hypothetical protein
MSLLLILLLISNLSLGLSFLKYKTRGEASEVVRPLRFDIKRRKELSVLENAA